MIGMAMAQQALQHAAIVSANYSAPSVAHHLLAVIASVHTSDVKALA